MVQNVNVKSNIFWQQQIKVNGATKMSMSKFHTRNAKSHSFNIEYIYIVYTNHKFCTDAMI